ncbi:leucyl aminopeptidase [soil metagenome]|nr:leucyl aminopeptidase [Gemmatimonadota bacterium]
MNITIERADCTEFETPLLAVKIFEGDDPLVGPLAKLDERIGGQISDLRRRGDFRGKEDESLVLYPASGALGAERLLLVGLGKREELDPERLRRAAGTAVKEAVRLRVRRLSTIMHHAELIDERITLPDAARAVAEGAVLGSYAFTEMKSPAEPDEERVEVTDFVILEKVEEKAGRIEEAAHVGGAVARGENLARTLGNLPGNVATPTYLAESAQRIAREHGLVCTVLGREELKREGLEALLAVSRGSDQEPRLIILEHRGGAEGEKPLVLLGKGLTFDSGGISIKPSAGMEEMKFDMCGGAATLGAMQSIAELGVKANVIGIVPSSENLISGSAVKPGDIIGSHLGKTIEVVNTDAEGRLILADALSYLRRFEPAAVVDAATLTGACVIALGNHASAVMGNDDSLIEELREAGQRAGERVWPLPMLPEYKEQLRSDYADIKNSAGRPAGAITAGWFLREFVGDFPWAHLDIAGTAYGDGKLSYQVKGATGVPTRLFVEWVLARSS